MAVTEFIFRFSNTTGGGKRGGGPQNNEPQPLEQPGFDAE